MSADAGVGADADPGASRDDAARLAQKLAGMVGSEAWSATLGIGSHLSIDLGERVEWRYELRGREHVSVVGEWHLWIQLAAWRLEDATNVLLGCEDPRPLIAEKIAVLCGRRVTAVEVKAPALETVFDFDGVRLLVFPVHSALSTQSEKSVSIQWSLWRPQGDIVSVGPETGSNLIF